MLIISIEKAKIKVKEHKPYIIHFATLFPSLEENGRFLVVLGQVQTELAVRRANPV